MSSGSCDSRTYSLLTATLKIALLYDRYILRACCTEEGSTPRVRQALLSVTTVLLSLLRASTPELEASVAAAVAACEAAGASNVALIHSESQPDSQADVSIAACTGV